MTVHIPFLIPAWKDALASRAARQVGRSPPLFQVMTICPQRVWSKNLVLVKVAVIDFHQFIYVRAWARDRSYQSPRMFCMDSVKPLTCIDQYLHHRSKSFLEGLDALLSQITRLGCHKSPPASSLHFGVSQYRVCVLLISRFRALLCFFWSRNELRKSPSTFRGRE